MPKKPLKDELDRLVLRYNTPQFINDDPLQFLWRFDEQRDIETVAALVAANTWGRRDLIIRACNGLMELLGNKPADFIAKGLYNSIPDEANIYRTFFGRDLKYFCRGLDAIFRQHGTLEALFAKESADTWKGIALFREAMRQANDAELAREGFAYHTGYNKHVANPDTSACKRLHMMLRWLVRNDGVDRGTWRQLSPKCLMIPMDTHVFHVARSMGLLSTKTLGRVAVEELTRTLRHLDPTDPVKYDFALFGYGVEHGI